MLRALPPQRQPTSSGVRALEAESSATACRGGRRCRGSAPASTQRDFGTHKPARSLKGARCSMYILEADAAGELVFSDSVCFRNQQLFASGLRHPAGEGAAGEAAWPDQLSCITADLFHVVGSLDYPAAVVVLVPITDFRREGGLGRAQLCGCEPDLVQRAMGAIAACFPRSVAPMDARSSESSDSDDSASGEPAAGGHHAAARRAKARADGWESAHASPLVWSVLESSSALKLGLKLAPDAGSAVPLNRVVLSDLETQYADRPSPEGGPAGRRTTAFLAAQVELGGAERAMAADAVQPARAASAAAAEAAAGQPGPLLGRRYERGAHSAGAERPLATIAVAAKHAQPALRALFLPTRGATNCLKRNALETRPVVGDVGAYVSKATASEAGVAHAWHATLYTVGTARRADWFGGGKTSREAEDEMRRKFASGSMRKLVPPTRMWSEAKADVQSKLCVGEMAMPNRDPRQRKVVAGPNGDSFIMLV